MGCLQQQLLIAQFGQLLSYRLEQAYINFACTKLTQRPVAAFLVRFKGKSRFINQYGDAVGIAPPLETRFIFLVANGNQKGFVHNQNLILAGSVMMISGLPL